MSEHFPLCISTVAPPREDGPLTSKPDSMNCNRSAPLLTPFSGSNTATLGWCHRGGWKPLGSGQQLLPAGLPAPFLVHASESWCQWCLLKSNQHPRLGEGWGGWGGWRLNQQGSGINRLVLARKHDPSTRSIFESQEEKTVTISLKSW